MATVLLRHPKREVTVDGARQVKVILRDLGIDAETVLVIKGNELLTREDIVAHDDVIELRPVISGGGTADVARSARPLT